MTTRNAAQALERIFRSVLNVSPDTDIGTVAADTHGGWDSISHISLVVSVEQDFGFTMTPEEATAARSFQQMLVLVESRTASR